MNRITYKVHQCGGHSCVRGMRIHVVDVLDMMAAGVSTPEILADYPDLQVEDVYACLAYAARHIDHPRLAA